jgi:uncharacterized membrane protein YdjX (TVP38/TMEM64 family)
MSVDGRVSLSLKGPSPPLLGQRSRLTDLAADGMVPLTPTPAPVHSLWLRLLLFAAVLGALLVVGRVFGSHLPALASWVRDVGPWGPVVFIIAYALACIVLVPASVLTLAAGAIFGLVKGTSLVFVAATLGSVVAFLISRHVARGMVERRIASDRRFRAIDRAIGESGFKIVALLRLSPIVPFSFLNYALGLTQVRFADYLMASVAMLPGTILYVYYGKLAGDLAAWVGGAPRQPRGPLYYVVFAIGLLATIVVTALLARLARRSLPAASSIDPQSGAGDATT